MHRLLRNYFKIHFTDCVKVAYWRRKLTMRGLWCFGSSSNRRFPAGSYSALWLLRHCNLFKEMTFN